MAQKSRYITLAGFVGCLIGFSFFAFLTATSRCNAVSNYFVQSFYHIFPLTHGFFGIFGFVLLISSSVLLVILFSWQNSATKVKSFSYVFQFFDLPVLIGFELWIAISDFKEMPIHVLMVLANTPLANIVTNWFVLIVSIIMFLFTILFHREKFIPNFCLVYDKAFKWIKTKAQQMR